MKHHLMAWKEDIGNLNKINSGTSKNPAVPVIVHIIKR